MRFEDCDHMILVERQHDFPCECITSQKKNLSTIAVGHRALHRGTQHFVGTPIRFCKLLPCVLIDLVTENEVIHGSVGSC